MNLNDMLIIGAGFAAILAVVILTMFFVRSKNIHPQVVVNMPADAKPLEQLAPVPVTTSISNEKAVLWWTVYSASIGEGIDGDCSADYANQAVDTCFGE